MCKLSDANPQHAGSELRVPSLTLDCWLRLPVIPIKKIDSKGPSEDSSLSLYMRFLLNRVTCIREL